MKTIGNKVFLEHISWLKEKRGVSYSAIAMRIGIDHNKMTNIRRGQSTASVELLKKLKAAYPELTGGGTTTSTDHVQGDPVKRIDQKIAQLEDSLKKKLAIAKEYEARIAKIEKRNLELEAKYEAIEKEKEWLRSMVEKFADKK